VSAAFFTVSVNNDWKGIGKYSTVGLDLALSILVGLFGGRFLDRKLGTGHWLTIIGLGFGIAAGVRSVWRALQSANREAEEQEREERRARNEFHEDDEER
jgi:F0F1-type ATP synthase assembly protein I